MDRSNRQKTSKIVSISFTNASPYPRAMMIVEFDATVALLAMKRPRRPQMLAGIAIAQLENFWVFNFSIIVQDLRVIKIY